MYPQFLREAGYYCTNRSKEDYNLIKPATLWERAGKNDWRGRDPGQPFFSIVNFTTSHEFAVAFLKHLDVRVDYFDWHFYAANGWNGKYDYLDTDDEWKHLYCWGTKFRECHEVITRLIRDECRQKPPNSVTDGTPRRVRT